MAKLPKSSRAVINAIASGYSIYEMRGVDGLVMRRKPKTKAKKIDPDSVQGRNIREFTIYVKAGKLARLTFSSLRMLADHNVTGPMNALMKKVQLLDNESELGYRGVMLSRHKEMLKGFSLNMYNTFDSVLRHPVSATINREELTALVNIPEIIPGVNFLPRISHPYFCFRACLGVVPDVFLLDQSTKQWSYGNENFFSASSDTAWHPVEKGASSMDIQLKLNSTPAVENFTLVLSIGICFGILKDHDTIRQAPRSGCAKVLDAA